MGAAQQILAAQKIAGGGSFTPVGDVESWLDFSALALANNDPISTVVDGSGNGNDATAVTTTRPLFKTNVKNSLGAGLFDGLDDFMTVAGIVLNNPSTVQIVFNVTSNASRMVIFDGNVLYSWIATNATPNYEYFGGADFRVGGTPDTSWHVITVIANGASTVIRVDGTALTLSGGSPGANNLSGVSLGRANTGGNVMSGHIGEVIMLNGVVDIADIEANEDGLGVKWGIIIA